MTAPLGFSSNSIGEKGCVPAAGLKAMQEELEYLKTVRRKELAEEIKEARSHGDLSENSEAKNTQGLVRTASPSWSR